MIFNFLLISLLALNKCQNEIPPRIVCHYDPNQAGLVSGHMLYRVDDIPSNKCTHVVYSSAAFNAKTFQLDNRGPETGIGSYQDFFRLHQLSPESKLMLSVHGAKEECAKYSKMVSSKETRKAFIDGVMETMNTHKHFEGLELSWHGVGDEDSGCQVDDKENYLKLAQELRKRFDEYANANGEGSRKLELSMSVPILKSSVNDGYQVRSLCEELDFVNLQTYTLRGAMVNFTDVNAPLNRRPFFLANKDNYRHLNVNDGAHLWNKLGCPKHKLIVGLAFYGRTYTLESTERHGLRAPIKTMHPYNVGLPGKFTNQSGFLSYYEFCSAEKDWIKEYDSIGESPYAYRGDQWIGYENAQSLEAKVAWLKGKYYGGVGISVLHGDDFRGQCGEKNILFNTVHKGLEDYTVCPKGSRAISTTAS